MNGVYLDIELRSFIRAERRIMSFNEFRMALHAFPYCQRSTLAFVTRICVEPNGAKIVQKITVASS